MSVSPSVVRKIVRGSVWARNLIDCVLALSLVGLAFNCVLVAVGGIHGQPVLVGPYALDPSALGPWSLRMAIIVMALIMGAIWTGSLYLVRGVFADLARGDIFCEANVRRIRGLGWLTIAGGVCGWLVHFCANAAYFMVAGHHGSVFQREPAIVDGFGQIVNGGLFILLSWIMAVGLGVREDAEELQREAELVV